MKKSIIMLFLIFAFSLSAVSHMTKIYHKDYGSITRLVIVFDKKIDAEIVSNPQQRKVEIFADNTVKSRIVESKTQFLSKNLASVSTEELSNGIAIVISLEKSFRESHFQMGNSPHKLVFDFFTVTNPKSYNELMDYTSFYTTVGFPQKAEKYFEKLAQDYPQKNGFYYHWALSNLKRGRKKIAIEQLKKVTNVSREFQAAFELLNKLAPDRNKTEAKPKQTPLPKQPVEPPKEETQAKETETTTTPLPQNDMSLENDLLQLFSGLASKDQKLQVLGQTAYTAGEYEKALEYLLPIEQKNEIINRELFEIYSILEDKENALYYKSLLLNDSIVANNEKSDTSFADIEIKLWMALLLCLLTAVIVFFLIMLHYNKKRNKILDDSFTDEEVDYHSNIIKKSYKKEEAPIEYDLGEQDSEKDEKPEEIADDLTPEDDEDDDLDYESAPNISEEITKEEEEDLVEDEENELNLFDDIEDNLEDEIDISDDDEDEESGLGKDEYQKKMILKLAKENWDAAAIAKELRISQNEVEFYLKTNE